MDQQGMDTTDRLFTKVSNNLAQNCVRTGSLSDLICQAVESISNGVVIVDAQQFDSPIVYVNSAFESITGYSAEEAINRNCRFLQGKENEQPGVHQIRQAIQNRQACRVVLRNFRKDGTLFWNELYVTPIHDSTGRLTHFIGVQNDVTHQRETQAALHRQEEDLRTIIDSMVDGLMIVDHEGKIIFVNPAAERIFGRPVEHLLGEPFGIPITVNSQATVDIAVPGKASVEVDFACSSILWQGSAAYLLSLRDITKQKQVYDPLTRLPTRVLFNERLQHVIDLSQRRNRACFALLFIDLDRFKVINDSLGHAAGDQLLIQFALRIQQQLRACDMLARLSGDEFAVLLEDLSHLDDATRVAERINMALTPLFELEGRAVPTSASIGIALGRLDLKQPEDLIREADTAMYRAKAQGGGAYAIFDRRMHTQAVARLQLETDLRHALQHQKLEVYYQPIIFLNSRRLLGFEALLRWHHPGKGDISPELFMGINVRRATAILEGMY